MYGLIGQILATPGKRDEVAKALTEGTRNLPGCLSFIIALDTANADALWVTEVWVDKESHDSSLQQPEVQAAIERAKPMIVGFNTRIETIPVGGV